MKTYTEAYRDSKKRILESKKAILESQKHVIVEAMKTVYGISGKISDMPRNQQASMAKRLYEYWDPSTGITKAGKALLNESTIELNKNSQDNDIIKFIELETKKNKEKIISAFKNGTSNAVINTFKEAIYKKTEKKVKDDSIRNQVWRWIEEDMKKG